MKRKSSILQWQKGLHSCFVITMLLIGMILPFQADAKQYETTGRVTRVVDGDTFMLTDTVGNNTIRIWGIDSPEKRQRFGVASGDYLAYLILNKPVVVTVKSKDKYGRLVGQVFYNGNDVGLTMVRDGMAWHYASLNKNKNLATAQAEAKVKKIGIWADPSPTPPWVFRKPKPQ